MPGTISVDKLLLKVEQVVGEKRVTEDVEATAQLPFDVIKIFNVVGNVDHIKAEVCTDEVLLDGIIDKQLFVVDRDDYLRHIPEQVPFESMVNFPGARPNMKAQIQVPVISIKSKLIQPDLVEQVITLEIILILTETVQVEVVTDVHGSDIVVDMELFKVHSVIGEDLVSEQISPVATLPVVAKKIIRIVPTVQNVTTEVQNDVVVLSGVIHKQIFFVEEEDPASNAAEGMARHATEDIPFTQTIPIPGARSGHQVQSDVRVSLENYELINAPGNTLKQTLNIETFVKVTETVQLEIVTDVRGPGIEVAKKLLKIESVLTDVFQEETLRNLVQLPQAIKIFEILANIVDLKAEVEFDRVIVTGVLHKQVFFVDADNFIRHHREDIPLHIVISVPGARSGMNVDVVARIMGDITHRIVDTQVLTVEQKAVIEVFVKVTQTVQREVVTEAVRLTRGRHPRHQPVWW